MIDSKTKLILALQQIDNVVQLTSDNEWKQYLYSHLISIKYELERQLANEHRRESDARDSSIASSSGESLGDC